MADGSAGAAAELVEGIEGSSGALNVVDRAAAFKCGANVTCGVATVTSMDPAKQHAVRVMFRKGMWEVYINDLLAQTFLYGGAYPLPDAGAGRIGLICTGVPNANVRAVRAWQMSL
jgi:hypothetical protein